MKLEVDYHHISRATFDDTLEFLNQMILTTSARNAERGEYFLLKLIFFKKKK